MKTDAEYPRSDLTGATTSPETEPCKPISVNTTSDTNGAAEQAGEAGISACSYKNVMQLISPENQSQKTPSNLLFGSRDSLCINSDDDSLMSDQCFTFSYKVNINRYSTSASETSLSGSLMSLIEHSDLETPSDSYRSYLKFPLPPDQLVLEEPCRDTKPDRPTSPCKSEGESSSNSSMIEHEGVENYSEKSYVAINRVSPKTPSEDANNLYSDTSNFYTSNSPLSILIDRPLTSALVQKPPDILEESDEKSESSDATSESSDDELLSLPESKENDSSGSSQTSDSPKSDDESSAEESDKSTKAPIVELLCSPYMQEGHSSRSGGSVSSSSSESDDDSSAEESDQASDASNIEPLCSHEMNKGYSSGGSVCSKSAESDMEHSVERNDELSPNFIPVVEAESYSPRQHELTFEKNTQLLSIPTSLSMSTLLSTPTSLSIPTSMSIPTSLSITASCYAHASVQTPDDMEISSCSSSVVLETALKIMHSGSSEDIIALCQDLEKTLEKEENTLKDERYGKFSENEKIVVKRAKHLLGAKTGDELERFYRLLIEETGVEDEEKAIEYVLDLLSTCYLPINATEELSDILNFCRNTLQYPLDFNTSIDNLQKIFSEEFEEGSLEGRLSLKLALDAEMLERVYRDAAFIRDHRTIQVPIQNSIPWLALKNLLLEQYPPEEVEFILKTGRRIQTKDRRSSRSEPKQHKPFSTSIPVEIPLIRTEVDLSGANAAFEEPGELEVEVCDISKEMAARIAAASLKKHRLSARKHEEVIAKAEEFCEIPEHISYRMQENASRKDQKMFNYSQRYGTIPNIVSVQTDVTIETDNNLSDSDSSAHDLLNDDEDNMDSVVPIIESELLPTVSSCIVPDNEPSRARDICLYPREDKYCISNVGARFWYCKNLTRHDEVFFRPDEDISLFDRYKRSEVTARRKIVKESGSSIISVYTLQNLLTSSNLHLRSPSCYFRACPCCSANRTTVSILSDRVKSLLQQFHNHMEFSLGTLLDIASFILEEDPEKREQAIEALEELDSKVWRHSGDVNIYRKVVMVLHLLDLETVSGTDVMLHDKFDRVLDNFLLGTMPDSSHTSSTTHVFGTHLILEEERRRFRATVDQLEKQRAEAQEEVDDLINALRRERDLGDEEIIFLKAQLRGISATKYETEDKVDNLGKENEQLKEDLKKETYKRKKLKERFLQLQELVNDENVVLLKEVEKRDEEIEALKEDIADVQDKLTEAEAEKDKANDKEDRILEECEKLNGQVDELEDQLRASARDVIAFKIVLDERGINTDDVFDDVLVQAKTDLEEAKRDKEDLQAQLEEIKEAVDDAKVELLEEIEAKEKKINQLKRSIEDKEYLHQTKQDDLFLDNEKLKEDIENLKEQLQEQLNNPSEELPEFGVSTEKYDQLLKEMEKEKEERNKLKNQYKDLKSYVDKDTADLIAEVQERDAVIESMNDKLNDLDELEKLEAELDWEKKNRKIDEAKIAELRNAISQDKKDIVADSEKKSDMIRQLKDTLTDAKTNLERARFKQREIISHNQKLRADNQALQKELDDIKTKGVPGAPSDRKVEDLLEELKDSNKDLEKERELRGQLHGAMQDLKHTLSDEDADLVDEIQKRDIIIANLHCQLREETDRLNHQLKNHRQREEQLLDDYQNVRDKIDDIEHNCEPTGHQPEIKDLERDMFEDLSSWLDDEVRILDTGLNDRVTQLADLEELLRNTPSFDEERVHYVKEIAAQEKEVNELRSLNRRMEHLQRDYAKKYAKKLEALNRENEALRRQVGGDAITSAPVDGSTESLPLLTMEEVDMEESGLGVSVVADSFDMQRTTPPGQAAESVSALEKYDDTKEKELVGQLRQIYSNLDLCRQDINRIVESFHDRIVRHHPRLQRTDSPTRLDSRNIGTTINSLIEGYHTQVTDLINRLNTDSSTIARRNENLEDVVQQLESNLNQERSRYDQLHSRCKSYRQEIQDLRSRLREGNIPTPRPLDGDHTNHDLCQAVHDLLNDLDSGPSTADGRRPRAPSIQEISRLLLPVAEIANIPQELATPDGAAFKEDCDVIQEKTDELSDLVKGLHNRLDAQKQAKIDELQEKVKEYEQEMDRLRDLIGDESEKENEIEALRERNRQIALNLRDSQEELEGADRKNNMLNDKFSEVNNALAAATEELTELRRKTREREAYIRQMQENLRRADENNEEKAQSNENLRNNCDELQEKAQQLSLLIKEVESKYVEKSRQYTILEKDITKVRVDHKVITEFCDKKNGKIEELEDDLRDLMKENEKLTDENKELTDETQVKNEKIKELETRLDAKEKLIAELEKVASKMADDISERDKVLQSMNDEVDKLEKEVEEKEEAIKQLEEDLDKQDQELEKLDHELEDTKEELKTKEEEAKDLEEEKTKLEDSVNELEDIIEHLKDDCVKVDKTVQDKTDLVNELKDAVNELEKDVQDGKTDNEKLVENVAELEKALEDAKKELTDLKDQMDEAKEEADKLQDDFKKLEDYVKDLEESLKEEKAATDEIDEESEKLKEEADKLNDTIADQKEDMEKLADIIQDLERDVEEAAKDKEDLKVEVDDLKNNVEEAAKDKEELKDLVEELKQDVEEVEKDNEELKDEVEVLKKDLEDVGQKKQDILDEVKEAMKNMDVEREDYQDNLEQLKDFLEAQKVDMDGLKSKINEKPDMEDKDIQTEENNHILIQTEEEEKPVCRSRRVQTDFDPVAAARATARTEIKKSSSFHILKNIVNTIDRPTQTSNYF